MDTPSSHDNGSLGNLHLPPPLFLSCRSLVQEEEEISHTWIVSSLNAQFLLKAIILSEPTAYAGQTAAITTLLTIVPASALSSGPLFIFPPQGEQTPKAIISNCPPRVTVACEGPLWICRFASSQLPLSLLLSIVTASVALPPPQISCDSYNQLNPMHVLLNLWFPQLCLYIHILGFIRQYIMAD